MTKQRMIALVLCLVAVVAVIGACVAYPPTPTADDTRGVAGPVEFRQVRVLNDLFVNDDATISGGLSVTGDVDLDGGNYPIENASANQIIEFGATGAITSTAVTPVAITTVTAYGCSVNSPVAGAELCYAQTASGVLTFTITGAQATPVAITTPHAAGASFWVGGN